LITHINYSFVHPFSLSNVKNLIAELYQVPKVEGNGDENSFFFGDSHLSVNASPNVLLMLDERLKLIEKFIQSEVDIGTTFELLSQSIIPLLLTNKIIFDSSISDVCFILSQLILTNNKKLQNSFQRNKVHTLVGKLYRITDYALYKSYSLFYSKNLSNFQLLFQKQFKKILNEYIKIVKNSKVKGLRSDSLFFLPVSHISNVKNVVHQILKLTPTSHPDFQLLSVLFHRCLCFDREMERCLSEFISKEKVKELISLFDSNVKVVFPSRTLLFQFEIQRSLYFSTIFLFNESREKNIHFFSMIR
jgi:hypothetical protein